MSISEFFRYLGAPLHNQRWSWGGTSRDGTCLVLRVWQDEKIKRHGKWYMRVTAHADYFDRPQDLGWQERLRHVESIRAGSATYMVMCEAVDPKDIPRKIKDFDRRDLFLGGGVEDHDGDAWLELKERIPAFKVQQEIQLNNSQVLPTSSDH